VVAGNSDELVLPSVSAVEWARRAAPAFLFLCVAVLLIGLFLFYGKAAETSVDDLIPVPSPVVSRSEYGFPQVQADLLTVRRQLFSLERVMRRIDFRGPESRAFKYLQAEMGLDACQDIVALDLEAPVGSHGFSLKSVCLRGDQKSAELVFRFEGGWVVARDNASGQQVDVPVLPSAKRAWDAGQRSFAGR
jgi:hypothetical protein